VKTYGRGGGVPWASSIYINEQLNAVAIFFPCHKFSLKTDYISTNKNS
jgi:hypothetical protein